MNELQTFWAGLDWSVLTDALTSIIPALICITFHELSHGLVAYKLGDNTAKMQGRLTLNPIKHIDIMGLLMMVVFKFGWAKPVPIDMRNFKNPKWDMAISALAGPVSNLILAVFVMLIFGLTTNPIYRKFGASGETAISMIYTTAYLSVALAVFNILPIPPLDGSKALFALLPENAYYKLMRYERYGMIILLVLVWTGLLTKPLSYVTQTIMGWLYNIAVWASGLVS